MIDLGVATWCLDVPGPNALYKAAELGLKTVQIDSGKPDSKYYIGKSSVLKKYRQISSISKVSIVGIGAKFVNDLGMIHNKSSSMNRNCQIIISDTIKAAVYLNTDFVFFPSFRKSEIRSNQSLHNTGLLLKQACIQAAPYGINIGSENSLDWKTNWNLINIVEKANFRILVDSYNPLIFGNSVSHILKKLTPYIAKQIHVKDGVDSKMGTVPLGMGEGRFFETMQTIKSINFEGVLLLENNYFYDPENLIKQDVETLCYSLNF